MGKSTCIAATFFLASAGWLANAAPVRVSAGPNQDLPAGTSATTLAALVDANAAALNSYSWTIESGPAAAVIEQPAALRTRVTGLRDGHYILRFTAADAHGATTSARVHLRIGPVDRSLPREASTPLFDTHTVTRELVPMRDGVKLAADVYRPANGGVAASGKFPVLVYRTPYNKAGIARDGASFARRGYVVVAQDCRGRFDSEGVFYPFLNEGEDGFDTIEWAAAQPWSDGKVGTIGGSYLAWDQYHAAMYRPPHLVAMFAIVGGANFYQEYGYPGGVPNLGWPLWILGSAATSPAARDNPALVEPLLGLRQNLAQWLALSPHLRTGVFKDFPQHARAYEDMYANPEFGPYWKQKGFYTKGHRALMKDVPTFFISGWYDYFGEGVLDNFAELSRTQKTSKKLWMGPWPHGTGPAICGDAHFGASAAVDVPALALEWFDHWMKGKELRAIGPEPVRIFRMGGGRGSRDRYGRLEHGGEWRPEAAWPAPDARASRYYIHAGGALRSTAPTGSGSSRFTFDPDRPVPTIGGRYALGLLSSPCAQDQVCSPHVLGCTDSAPLKDRADVLSFETPPLEAPVDVTGMVRANLWISSDAPDTDFTAKLVDVYPDGYSLIILDGRVRARFREGFEKSALMTPGKAYQVSIELGSTSNLFQKGHRIRLDVSSSNYPAAEPNPNTGEPAGKWTRRVKAENTVHHSRSMASYVELPVLPAH